jgi:hypothetical protein
MPEKILILQWIVLVCSAIAIIYLLFLLFRQIRNSENFCLSRFLNSSKETYTQTNDKEPFKNRELYETDVYSSQA